VSEVHDHASPAESDGLWRWLVGGLVVGGVILGLLIGAYAIGYDRGQDEGPAAAAVTAPATTTPATTGTSAGELGPVTVTPALVARGTTLYTADGCAACHSLKGAAGAGPPLNGLAGSSVTLADGRTVTADDAYLERSITAPDAEIRKGYHAGVMPAAVAPYHLDSKPDDVRALVAFLKLQQ
jgi:mono/diheme cytochrome c family protein